MTWTFWVVVVVTTTLADCTDPGLREIAETVPVTSRQMSRTAAKSFMMGISCD
jgi:hypothetical protein